MIVPHEPVFSLDAPHAKCRDRLLSKGALGHGRSSDAFGLLLDVDVSPGFSPVWPVL